MMVSFEALLAFACFGAAQCGPDVRLVDAAGSLSSVGLLQVRTENGFGSVCGANPAAADVICRSMGYAHGSVGSSPCGFYGGADLCGSAGSPVAMADLQCTGSEWSIEECLWEAPDEACVSHRKDTIVFCSKLEKASAPHGASRLISYDGSPSTNGKGRPEIFMGDAWTPICKSGMGSGTAAVICKSMGFSGASATGFSACGEANGNNFCGDVEPALSELACSGSESDVLACPHEAGDDVFCAPSESVVVECVGDGETQGRMLKEAAPQPLVESTASLAPVHRNNAIDKEHV